MTARGASRRLEVRIASDATQFNRGLQQAQRQTQSFGRQMDTASKTGVQKFNGNMDIATKRMSGFESRLRSFHGLLVGGAIGAGLARWAGGARESANNLTESINAVQVVFGEATQTITDFGETAAETAGLANSEFNQLVVPIGSMLRNFGFDAHEAADATVILAQRAADMASVFNVDVADALGAIQAALRGEADPIERFGASISAARVEAFLLAEGLVESKSAITDSDKVMGRYRLILEDTARVAGDFAATSDENANKTRIFQARVEDLQAAVGAKLIPLFDSLVDTGEDLLPVLETLGTDVLPVVVDAFGDFLAGVAVIVESIGSLPESLGQVTAALGAAAAAARLLYAHPVIAGLGLVVAGVVAIGDAARTEAEQVDELRVAIETLLDTGEHADLFGAVKQDVTDLITSTDELTEGFEALGIPLSELTDFVLGDPAAIDAVTDAVTRLQEVASTVPGRTLDDVDASRTASRLAALLEDQQRRRSGLVDTIEEERRALRELNDEGTVADNTVQRQATAQARLNDTREETVELSEDQVAALEAEKEAADELTGGIRDLAQAYAAELNAAALEYLDIFEAVEEVEPVQGIEQLLANTEARVETISAFLAGIQRLRDEGLFELAFEFQTQGVSAQNVAELEGVIADIDRGGATAFELDETLDAARDETGRITAAMGLELARSKSPLLAEAQRLGVEMGEAIAQGVERVALNFSIRVGATDTGSSGVDEGGSSGSGTPFASGGRFRPGQRLLVGEYRPEIVEFDRGGVVHPSVDQFAASMLRPDSGLATVTNIWHIPIEGTGDPQVDAQRVGAVASVLRRMETR